MKAQDQAEGLRRLIRAREPRVINVVSCIERVGRTSLVTGLASVYASQGREVWILDGSSFAGNVCEAYGLQPRRELLHVMYREARLEDVLLEGPQGVRVLPATRALKEFAVNDARVAKLFAGAGVVLVDAPRGDIPRGGDVVVATTAQPAALIDTWAWLKLRTKRLPAARASLLVCRAEEREARIVHANLTALAQNRLHAPLDLTLAFAGALPARAKSPAELRELAARLEALHAPTEQQEAA